MPQLSVSYRQLAAASFFGFIPFVFLAIIMFYQFFGSLPGIRDSREAVTHTFEVIRVAKTIEQKVGEAEAGGRGFLITGDQAYLGPYEAALPQIPELLAQLQALVADNPEQQRRLLTLQGNVTTKLNVLRATVDTMRTAGFDAARAVMLNDVGRQAMDDIRNGVADFVAVEDGLLRTRLAAAVIAEERVRLSMFGGAGIAFAALLVGSLLLSRAYRHSAAAERVLRATLDSVREGVTAFDPEGRLVVWSSMFEDVARVRSSALQSGMTLAQFQAVVAQGGTGLSANIGDLDAESRRVGRSLLVENKSGNSRIYQTFVHALNEGGFVATYLDVTERRRTEAISRQAQKLEALGQMTGGIAHDFNNLLTIITGNLDLLRRTVSGNKPAEDRIALLLLGAERAAKLTTQLLAFARRQPLEPQVTNLGQLLPETEALIRRAVGASVEVECVGAPGLWNTLIDPTQFQSAALNLAINARDAMPDGGKLTIEVSNLALDDDYAAQHADVTAGQYVLFAVTDTGHGMDAETVARALDPFFTTKPAGQGTGLGLSMVYGFVKQSGGHLKIYSEPNQGTTIKIYLPRSVVDEVLPSRSAPVAPMSGCESILLVDDDEVVRTTVADMLADFGYQVTQADSGADGLAHFERGATFDLLFTDVVMPGNVSSRTMAKRAVELQPGLKVLFTSGYTQNAIIHHGRVDPGVELLSKPYTRDRLATKIRSVLDGPPPRV